MQEECVPKDFKRAIITPLIKKKSAGTTFSNYRPVSNLPFLSKILERIVLDQLIEHCTQHGLYDQQQSAYRSGHSTETALLKIFDQLLDSMDKQQVSILTLLDLSAAFDTVNHSILLRRLDHSFGIRNNALGWFRSYLDERMQQVRIGNSLSVPRPLTTGVPQGSGLGPWMYTSYTRNLSDIILLYSIFYHLFADDTQLQISMDANCERSQFRAKATVEKCVKHVSDWMNSSKLKLNSEKTEVIVIGTRQQLTKVKYSSINVCGTAIPFKDSVKNLGVHIDSDLKMRTQVNAVIKACYYNLHMLRRFKHILPRTSLHALVQAFVMARLDYANALYIGIPEYLLSKLQRIQNFAVRLIYNLQRHDHVTPYMIELHWLPIRSRITYKIAVLVFKCLKGQGPVYLTELIAVRTANRRLRSSASITLHQPAAKLKYAGERRFSYTAPKIWNSLPSHIRDIDNLTSFKSKLKCHLFRIAYIDYL